MAEILLRKFPKNLVNKSVEELCGEFRPRIVFFCKKPTVSIHHKYPNNLNESILRSLKRFDSPRFVEMIGFIEFAQLDDSNNLPNNPIVGQIQKSQEMLNNP